MKRNLIFTGQWLITALILAISLSAYGCKDTVSVSEDVSAPLSSLTVTPGIFQPAFFANTTNYAVNAPTSAASVTVTAVPKDNTATVTIDGFVTTQRSVTLGGPGSTKTILIVVETLNGLQTTYTVSVTRLLSNDNKLSALTVTPGALNPSPFNADTLDYTVDVATSVASVTVTATKSDPNAVMTGSVPAGAGVATGQATILLGGPGTATPISITVTAPNGSNKTYAITVNRAASSNNNLAALTVTANNVVQPLAPGFNASTLSYMVNVATTVTSVDVSATKADLNAVMLIGSVTVPAGTASGQETFPLNGPGTQTVLSVSVTAQSGGAPKTYTITVNRAASSDNNLSTLSLTTGTVPLSLTPTFDPNHLDYTVEVPIGVIEVTVTATKSDPNAVMSGSVTAGTGVATGQATILFIFLPPPQVSITVTAPSGVFKTYTIIVNQTP